MNWLGPFPFRQATRAGSILILALWSIALLGSFSISMGYHVRQKMMLAERIDNRNYLYGVAQKGIEVGIAKLLQKKKEGSSYFSMGDSATANEREFRGVKPGEGEGRFTVSYEYPLPTEDGTKIIYGIQDEASKLNLNQAPAKTIRNLFQIIAGLDEEEASEIAYSIADWRDSDSSLSHPDYGAEDDYYEDLDAPYGAKDHNLETLNELLLVRGMTMEIYEKVKPYVTIYGGKEVNINTASRSVLLGLGFSETLVNAVVAYRSGTDRIEGTADDRVFSDVTTIADNLILTTKLSGSDANTVVRLVDEGAIAIGSDYFQIRSRGELWQRKLAVDIVAVSNLEGKIFSWQSGIPRSMNPVEIKEAEDFEKNKEGDS